MVALVLARAGWRSSAATRWPRPAPTSTLSAYRGRSGPARSRRRPPGSRASRWHRKRCSSGMPGSGKSTIGRRLAKTMRRPAAGHRRHDRGDHRPHHRRHLRQRRRSRSSGASRRTSSSEALAAHDGIVSLGGGAVTSAGVARALAGHTVIYLEISAAEGIRRTPAARPPAAGRRRSRREVPHADGAARAAVPRRSRPCGSTPTAATPAQWCATSCAAGEPRTGQSQRAPRGDRRGACDTVPSNPDATDRGRRRAPAALAAPSRGAQ